MDENKCFGYTKYAQIYLFLQYNFICVLLSTNIINKDIKIYRRICGE